MKYVLGAIPCFQVHLYQCSPKEALPISSEPHCIPCTHIIGTVHGKAIEWPSPSICTVFLQHSKWETWPWLPQSVRRMESSPAGHSVVAEVTDCATVEASGSEQREGRASAEGEGSGVQKGSSLECCQGFLCTLGVWAHLLFLPEVGGSSPSKNKGQLVSARKVPHSL